MRHEDRHTMKWLSDQAVDRLRVAAATPDLSGTGFVLLGKLGAGGMGSVFRVEDTALGRQVALKVLGIVDSSGEFGARLLREAKIIAQLEHPGIVPVHDVGTLPDGRVFYTMKLVQGRRLDQYRDEPGGVPERLRTFQKICEAVSFAHAHQVLHRDLKPQNIMVGKFGEVLVMDWGLATLLNAEIPAASNQAPKVRLPPQLSSGADTAEAYTAHGVVLGTPGYMAPEQARGDVEAVGPRADVYSLGAVLGFLLDDSGRVPKALSAITSKATAEDAGQRYGSVEEMANDIAHYLDGLPVSAYPEGVVARLWRWMVKNSAWILLIVAYLVMRALFVLWRGR